LTFARLFRDKVFAPLAGTWLNVIGFEHLDALADVDLMDAVNLVKSVDESGFQVDPIAITIRALAPEIFDLLNHWRPAAE
jgi:hypothetical protein